MDEFQLIQKYFHNDENKKFSTSKSIVLGVGDDAAVLEINPQLQLVTSLDTLVENVHFPANCKAEDIAYKALAVNLSDLAAMGATPHSFTLSITLPSIQESWLENFSKALFVLANQHQLVLLGGDTSKGPLSISIQINGVVEKNKFLTRSAAKVGDVLCASGYLGLAAFGLKQWQAENNAELSEALARFLRPEARIRLAQQFFNLGVRACIDISDGLLSEVKHLCNASRLSAWLDVNAIVVHPELSVLEKSAQQQFMLSGGDDYELCFSISKDNLENIKTLFKKENVVLNILGEFVDDGLCEVRDTQGNLLNTVNSGYTHF